MIENVGYCATYWFYASVSIVTVILVVTTLPETKGRSIDVINIEEESQ